MDSAVPSLVQTIVLASCPSATVAGAWVVAGPRGGVLIRFHRAGKLHVVPSHRLRFDLSGPVPQLVVADPLRIDPPLTRTWSEALGAWVESRPYVEPVEVVFPPLSAL